LLCVLLALLSSTTLALDPNQPLSRLHHSTWTSRNGLDGAVDSLEQTADGFLWVGTTLGLYRYDGFMFERYKPEVGSFPGVAVSALLATRDGGLWIGFSQGGATFLKEGKATNYSEEEGFPVSRVRSFAQDFDGTIWADVIGGFTRRRIAQRFRKWWNYPSKAKYAVRRFSGTLWVGTSKEMMYHQRRKFRDLGIFRLRVRSLRRRMVRCCFTNVGPLRAAFTTGSAGGRAASEPCSKRSNL
jgi:ligand-binding sensor domain-containing protein